MAKNWIFPSLAAVAVAVGKVREPLPLMALPPRVLPWLRLL